MSRGTSGRSRVGRYSAAELAGGAPTAKTASLAASAAAAAMTTPAQFKRLGEHLRKLRLLKGSERLEVMLPQAAA